MTHSATLQKSPFRQAKFLMSVAKLSQLPIDEGIEVAFAGRSNAGKSSALNAITDIKGLARTSKTPGRTQLINLFTLADKHRLVDLPGYGYAKVSPEIKERWQHTLDRYLQTRQCLRGLILLMDIRHPLKEFDKHMIEWASQSQIDIHILLTKSDKLTRNNAQKTLKDIGRLIAAYDDRISVQTFSTISKDGLDEVRQVLSRWFKAGNGQL